MAVRSTMAALIARVRIMVNDVLPLGSGQIFADNVIQDVMDETRLDLRNHPLTPIPTFSGSTISYLDYFSEPGLANWEDDVTLWQYRTTLVTPSLSENIVGHWAFALTTLPPVYANGKSYDVYRSSADLLERWAAQWALSYDFTADSQSLHRSQATIALQKLAQTYRQKQRALSLSIGISDLAGAPTTDINLKPHEIDYMGSG